MLQVLNMTNKERVKMYMKCKKKQLAKMLAERDRIKALGRPSTTTSVYVPPISGMDGTVTFTHSKQN